MSVPSTTSVFEGAEFIPTDAVFDVTRRYLADTNPNKVNLGQGAYRDEHGRPWILPSVRMAKELLADENHEYLPIAGLKALRDEGVKLVFHGTNSLSQERVSPIDIDTMQWTGALLLAGLALKQANTGISTIYITDPTWSNHNLLFSRLGFQVKKLPYYKDGSFDFDGYINALTDADTKSAVVMHACAHNPTGCDPSEDQWKAIATVVRDRQIFPIFDSAYLGFNSGSVDKDAWAIRYFTENLGLEASVCLSFAKSMGLYGERIGLVTFVTKTAQNALTMSSILENVQRATVSNPPAYGAKIAASVLGTPAIAEQWANDLLTMSGRIRSMRHRVYEELVGLKTPGEWSHIVKQGGMFGYTGISPAQVAYLEDKYHVYMSDTSRISIAGLNESNVAYFAKALDDAVRTV